MNSFRYQAVEAGGGAITGVIEAEDRKTALQLLGERNLFPSSLETVLPDGEKSESKSGPARMTEIHFGRRIRRRDISAFTREISALLSAAIPIPQALDSLGEEEENPAFRAVVKQLGEAVRKGE